MSKPKPKKDTPAFTRKQIGIIFKIAFLEAMALSIIVPTIQSSGELPATPDQPNELTNIQNGTATISITAGTTQGTTTITYSPAYTLVPKLSVLSHSGMEFTTSIFVPNPTAFFQSSPTTTWTNMPATDNEVYNDANGEHRIAINLSNMASFRFGVDCITPSNTLGAYLTIMYLNGGVWTELNSAQRFLIDNSDTRCPSLGSAGHFGNVAYSSIPSAAKQTEITLRIDGVGGGGIGDTPSFSSLWIDWSSSATGNNIQTVTVTGTWRACATLVLCNTTPPVATSKTGFIIAVIFPIAPTVTQTAKFTWYAGTIQ